MATGTVPNAGARPLNLPPLAAHALVEAQLMAGSIESLTRMLLNRWPASVDGTHLCEAILACTQRLGAAVDTALDVVPLEVTHG